MIYYIKKVRSVLGQPGNVICTRLTLKKKTMEKITNENKMPMFMSPQNELQLLD